MSYQQLFRAGPALRFALSALALQFLFGLQTVLAERAGLTGAANSASEPAADAHRHEAHDSHHSSEDDTHRHHKVPAGLQRSVASYSIPEVTLINQAGEPLALPGLLDTDKPVMLNFIFTSCTAICPAMTAVFAKVQTELGSDSERILMVSVSIDPEHDTPQALAEYARRFDAGPQWQFLTGDLDDCIAVQRAFDADRGDKMNHAPLTLFRATPEAQWVRYEGFANASRLVEEYRSVTAN